ncbi:PIN domain protein [Thiorhodovibrio winogradskyi]|uniref:PIN domain protein n=1 Tax=Thiorhodovibrio winogradskyi TaxID=77007 RepID=A0ABZ0SDM4_9GAMM|nr:PIN domain-containing protein [Thiorhodovibrio winogradskyi]
MIYQLDTNAINDLLREQEPLMTHFRRVRDHARFILCPVVDFEIRRYLLLKAATRNLAHYETLISAWYQPVTTLADWRHAAELWAQRHRIGNPISDADLLIAVCALRHNAILVTNNTAHFLGIGLQLADWRQ